MKGPSLEAIRRFKEEQEKKKKEQDEKKIKEKLSTLEHRAAQGDRKAKTALIKIEKIEKIKEEKEKAINETRNAAITRNGKIGCGTSSKQLTYPSNISAKPKPAQLNFDQLMNLAKQNNNELRKPETPKVEEPPPIVNKKKVRVEPKTVIKSSVSGQKLPPAQTRNLKPNVSKPNSRSNGCPPPVISNHRPLIRPDTRPDARPGIQSISRPVYRPDRPPAVHRPDLRGELRPPIGSTRMPDIKDKQMAIRMAMARHRDREANRYRGNDYYEDEEAEDDYEDDLADFVVDEDDDDVADEVRKTIQSVFKYDKKRCDRREEELDRQYRAIGRVNTFEDLEREERRASRLAAAEDARAQREEDERKRLKALRLKKHRA